MRMNSQTAATGKTVSVTGVTIAVSSGMSNNAHASRAGTTAVSADETTGAGSDNGTGWSRPLVRPVRLPGGMALKTLADAGAYILGLPEHIKQRKAWQSATDLLLKAASGAANVEDATARIEQALFMSSFSEAKGPGKE
jgi:hypothetical protein